MITPPADMVAAARAGIAGGAINVPVALMSTGRYTSAEVIEWHVEIAQQLRREREAPKLSMSMYARYEDVSEARAK